MYKILLVEDEVVIRKGFKDLITRLSNHFTVIGEASHGKEALEFLRIEVPDLIITDIRMPEMDGLTFIEKLRDLYQSMPVVITSGYGEFEYAQKALKFGVNDYLLKPIERVELITTLEKIKRMLDEKNGLPYGVESDNEVLRVDPTGQDGDARKTIRDVKNYIKLHLVGDLRLQTVAEHVHLNSNYLSQFFKSQTGMNYSDYLTEVRMERAKGLLTHTNLKIYDIARLSGYQSPKHFMLLFKKMIGQTPSEYREQHSQIGLGNP